MSKPREDGTYALITTIDLMTGRSSFSLPDDTSVTDSLAAASRYRIINNVTNCFWQMWSKVVSPGLIVCQKWHKKSRNLNVGDLVLILEPTKFKASIN